MNNYRAKENGQPGLGVMKIRNRCQSVVTAIGTDVAKRFQAIVLSGLFVLSTAALAQSSEWVPITGAETLRKFMSGTKVERKLPSGDMSRGEYHPDGTGTLYSWGASIPRTGRSRATSRYVLPWNGSPGVTSLRETALIRICTEHVM
jgi:hypothetical protein